MKRKCVTCGNLVNVNVGAAVDEFKQRFEGEDILEAVVMCGSCEDEIDNFNQES